MGWDLNPETEEDYQRAKKIALAGALWPESFSGVCEGELIIPMLRFRAGELDLSRWPKSDEECDFMWNIIGGDFGDPAKAEMIGLLVVEWEQEKVGYRFAIDLRTNMRRVFSAIHAAEFQLMVTADPKGQLGISAGLSNLDGETFRHLEALAHHIESHPELHKEERNGERISHGET